MAIDDDALAARIKKLSEELEKLENEKYETIQENELKSMADSELNGMEKAIRDGNIINANTRKLMAEGYLSMIKKRKQN